MTIKDKLISAVTQYDAKQLTRTGGRAKGYNPNALGIYFARVDDICADIKKGADLRKAICAGFTGQIATTCLREFGLSKWTKEGETREWHYVPANEA